MKNSTTSTKQSEFAGAIEDYSAACGSEKGSLSFSTGVASIAANSGDKSCAVAHNMCAASVCSGDASYAKSLYTRSLAANTGRDAVAENDGFKSIAACTSQRSKSICKGFGAIAANTGDYGKAIADGTADVAITVGYNAEAIAAGKASIAIATGQRSLLKGSVGSVLIWVQYNDYNSIGKVVVRLVDGKEIKENTYYRLVDDILVEVSDDKKYEWFEVLGARFEQGGREPSNKPMSIDCYTQPSESGDIEAMYHQAFKGMKDTPVSSADLMREAACMGNNDAAWWLAKNLFHGAILPNDYEEAFKWLYELSLRGKLSPCAGFLLGRCYYNGHGTAVDYNAAVQALLGAFESSGKDKWGSPLPDNTDARSKGKDTLTEADIRTICHILGECFYYGKGVEKDYCQALKYLLLSVQDGEYIYPDKDAEYLIGTCYYYHLGTHQDISTALIWLQDAEKHGSVEAAELLAKRNSRKGKKHK